MREAIFEAYTFVPDQPAVGTWQNIAEVIRAPENHPAAEVLDYVVVVSGTLTVVIAYHSRIYR